MELVCPECMGPLATTDGKTARCTIHGGRYEILFSRSTPVADGRAAAREAWSPSDPWTEPVSPARASLGVPCIKHPAVDAMHRCRSCGAPICETCAFKFPGGVVVCPACAASPKSSLSPKRRTYLVLSFICATIATLFLGVVFSGALSNHVLNQHDAEALGVVILLVVLGTTIPGIALAASARLPRRPAPIAVWIASIWNILLLGGFFLLMLIGIVAR